MMRSPRRSTRDIMVVCDNIDRLVTAPLRTLGHPRAAYVAKLYRRARAIYRRPISYLAAKEILGTSAGRIALVTGTYNPVYFPGGETDGPVGAAVLGRVLSQLGHKVTFCVEKQIAAAMERFAETAGGSSHIEGLTIGQADGHAYLAQRFDGAVFIEKIGVNSRGVHHTSSGMSSDTDDANVAGLVREMSAAGKWMIGLGDGGNEVGFGSIHDYVRKIVRYGAACRCPCGGGIATTLATKILFPVSISNWGAYGIIAAMALIRRDFSLLHTPEMEVKLLELAPTLGCYEGTVAKGKPCVDAVPAEGSAAMVQLLKSAVEVAYGETIPLDERRY